MIRSLSTHSFLYSTVIFPLGRTTLLPSKVCKVYSFLHLGNWVRARIPVRTRAVSALMSSKSGMEQVLVENEVQQVRLLDSVNDDHGGVIVELSESMDSKVFASMLKASLALWRSQGKRGVWIKVPIELVNLVEAAVKEGFWFHHAEPKYLMLAFWIPEGAHALPANASHRVGVGAFVMNKKREVLVVQEKSGIFRGTGVWKFPTGVVDEGEDICAAAMREVKEETGFVLNIVKKEDLARPSRIHDLENYNSEVPECVQLDCPEKDMDASSESDYASDKDDSPATDSLHKSASALDHTDDSVVHDIQEKHVVDG